VAAVSLFSKIRYHLKIGDIVAEAVLVTLTSGDKLVVQVIVAGVTAGLANEDPTSRFIGESELICKV
jgi:hypothetical protein